MTRKRRGWWFAYFAGSVGLLAVLSAVTASVLELEANGREAQRFAAEEALIRRALWRMDTWLAPLLSHESNRGAQEYTALSVNPYADPGQSGMQREVSPILLERNVYFPLHFEATQSSADGSLTLASPQVPPEDSRDSLLTNGFATEEELVVSCSTLDEASTVVTKSVLERFRLREKAMLAVIEDSTESVVDRKDLSWYSNSEPSPQVEREVSKKDRAARQRANVMNVQQRFSQQKLQASPTLKARRTDETGPLVPIWTDASKSEAAQLIFLRRVLDSNPQRFQGFTVDWAELSNALTSTIEDLAPEAELEPVANPSSYDADDDVIHQLTTVPATLLLPAITIPIPNWSAERSILLAAWIAVLLAIAMTGFGLRAIERYGERRSRFASAVTHELRTPLTTFQLYSEMLAEGLVQDPEKRQEYLETLNSEAQRLSSIVENVLSYARIDEGRHPFRVESTQVGAIVDHVRPVLERRLADADLDLAVTVSDPETTLRTDQDAVSQILFNLVDNAAKYASKVDLQRVDLNVARNGRSIVFTVRDHGPGLPTTRARTVFQPFERAGRESSNIPGVGLGLPLARALAKDLGGTLTHESAQPGARFELSLPLR